MAQRNQEDKQVGIMGGDSASTNTPFENNLRGVPDVSFSDTSLPVFADQFQVVGTWNMPVTELIPQTGGPVHAGVGSTTVAWRNPDDTETPFDNTGTVEVTHFNDSNIMFFSFKFPVNRKGYVVVSVNRRSATSAVDNRTKGPPKTRVFRVEYDTTQGITPDTINDEIPALLRLSEPAIRGTGTWRQVTYLQGFYFTKPVSEFTEDDVNISVAGSGTAILSDFQKTQQDNQLYTALITFTGSGTYQISVDANIAKSAGSEVLNTPPEQVSTSWAFDVSGAGQDFEIQGVEVICNETIGFDTPHPELDNDERGLFLGVSDMHVENGRVYFTSQIQKKRPGQDEASTFEESAGALVSAPVTQRNGSCEVHRKYPFFRKSARSLVSHRGDTHFFEGSAYIYDGSAQPNYTLFNVGGGLGVIHKINASGEISEVGLNWRSDFPTGIKDKYDGEHGGTMCPMISYEDNLHLISERFDNSGIDGVLWITYGKQLNRRVSLLETNGKTGFEVLEELARLTNSIIGFKNGVLIFQPRTPTTAFLSRNITETQTSIRYKLTNRDIGLSKASGFLKIDGEIMSYVGLLNLLDGSGVTFEEVKRGLADTDATTHAADSKIILIDRIINAIDLERPVNDMDIDIDGTLLENNILVRYAEGQIPRSDYLSFPAVDRQSIMLYGEHEQEITLPLDYHQHRWVIDIAEERIKRFKKPQKTIRLDLKRDFEISLGEIIYLAEPILSNTTALCQVMSVSQDKEAEETRVILVEIS